MTLLHRLFLNAVLPTEFCKNYFAPISGGGRDSGGTAAVDTGDIANSLRFAASRSCYMSWTPSVSGNRRTYTISKWIKRGKLGVTERLVSAYSGGSDAGWFSFNTTASDELEVQLYSHGVKTSAKFRDPARWIHIVLVIDTTQATASDRVKLYVDNELQTLVTSFGSGIAGFTQNLDTAFNSTCVHNVGALNNSADSDRYDARNTFVDGTALTPSAFGYLNTEINKWVSKSKSVIKALVAAGGINSRMYDFDDATSLTTLGYDCGGSYSLNLRSSGTNIGGFTANGGLAAAFDGTVNTYVNSAKTPSVVSGYTDAGSIGKDWGAGTSKTIIAFRVSSGSDGSFSGTAVSIGVKLQGSNDASAWTDLYTGSVPSGSGVSLLASSGITTTTAYRYHRVVFGGDGSYIYCGELEFYEAGSYGFNHATLSGFSLTAGPNYDHMKDSPSHVNGGGYATLNPLNSAGTLSDGNLKSSSPTVYGARAWIPFSSGKWVWWVTLSTKTSWSHFGVIPANLPLSVDAAYTSSSCSAYSANSGNKVLNGTASAYGATGATGDVFRVECNADANTMEIFKQTGGSGSFVSLGSFTLYTPVGTPLIPFVNDENNGGSVFTINFGQQPQSDTPTTGFKTLCQANLPEIPAATRNPKKHANVVLYNGDGTADHYVTGAGHKPDFVWIKNIGASASHALINSVCGNSKDLATDSTAAEATTNIFLGDPDPFGLDGFHLVSNALRVNAASNSYAALTLKAGGNAVTNTQGTITSQVSANVDAGFSIVTWTGTGVSATVGHGLPVAPKLVIVKVRGGVTPWPVYHVISPSGLYLNQASTQDNTHYAGLWNSTAPTSSVFSLGTSSACNTSGVSHVAYCFADNRDLPGGIFRCFSYTGNGSTDGPNIDMGGKVLWNMVKQATPNATSWWITDIGCDPYNPASHGLAANTADAQSSGNTWNDVNAQSVKVRNAGAGNNTSGSTYVGLAILACHGKYS